MPRKKRNRNPRSVEPLLKLMATLRSPGGCPWDREQSHESIKQCVIEEAYEVVEAIESRRSDTLCDELGDLLLQVVFHAQLAAERGAFDFYDVVDRLTEKLVRRHPHVFGTGRLPDAQAVLSQWERIKRDERKGAGLTHRSAIDGVPNHLPALIRAEKLRKKAAKSGLIKDPERSELQHAESLLSGVKEGASKSVISRLLGELLLTVAAMAGDLGLEPEQLLRRANNRFERETRKRERAATQ